MRLVLGVTTLDASGVTRTRVGVRDDLEEPVVVVGLRRWQELQRAEARLRELREREMERVRASFVIPNPEQELYTQMYNEAVDFSRSTRGK